MQTSATPLPGHAHIFQQYLQHTYVCIHIRWDVREALTVGYQNDILLCPPHWGWIYYFCFFRRAPSVTLGFRSFQGKVFILCLPNLVWVFIGLIACMGLL